MSISDEDISQCSHIAKFHYNQKKNIPKSKFDLNIDNCSALAQEQFLSNLSENDVSLKMVDEMSNFSQIENLKKKDEIIDNVSDLDDENNSFKSEEDHNHKKNHFHHSVFNKKD